MSKKKKYEIEQTLVASTAHIEEHDNTLLSVDLSDNGVVVHPYDFGHYVWIAEDDPARFKDLGYSQAFCDLVAKAKELEVSFLKLDRDGPVYEDMPTFDW